MVYYNFRIDKNDQSYLHLFKGILRSIIYCFFILITSELSAQSGNLKFERVTTEKGQSNGTVSCVLKDKLGFMWLGTNKGLIRYDGYSFKEFKHNPSDSNSISGNQIWSIIQDKYGDIWIGTSGKGLNKYLYKEDRFIHYIHNPADSTSLGNDLEIPWLFEDSEGEIWIALWEGGFDKYDRKHNNFVHFRYKKNNSNSIINNSGHRIFEDKHGFLWLGTSKGLSKFDRKKNKFTTFKNDPLDKNSLAGNYINSITEDYNGNLWIATYDGLSKYDEINNNFINYRHEPGNENSLSSSSIFSICPDKNGNLWIGTDGSGLDYYDTKFRKFTHFYSAILTDYTLSASSIPYMFIDNQSILWIGTVADGLYKVVFNKNKFSLLNKTSDFKMTSNIAEVSAIYEDNNGIIWIGTYGSGLNRYDLKSNSITQYKKSDNTNSISDDFILSIEMDSNRNLWIGTENGLNFFDPITKRFTKYFAVKNDTTTIAGNKITSLLIDTKGTLWIGNNGGGLNIFNSHNKSFTRISTSNLFPDFESDHVWTLYEDKNENIWIGTWGLGVIKYNYASNSFTPYNSSSLNADSIDLKVVVSIAEDKESDLWFGTWGNGLIKFEPAINKLTSYRNSNKIPHENIYGILRDSSNNLWISTGNGITKYDPIQNYGRTYDEEDGLQSLEFKRGAFHKGKSGRFYFGGVNGLNYFYPENVVDKINKPSVAFTSFKIFEEELSPFRFGNNVNELQEIILPYNENFISFEFSALEYTSPSKNQYAYKLEGIDKDWAYSETRRYAGYTDLKPGEYILKIKASNSDGVWNDDARIIKLIITPPIWMTWYAFILYSVFFIIILYLFRKYELNKRKLKEDSRIRVQREEAELREVKLKAETAELKTKTVEIEKEFEKQQMRNRIAADLHDEIGSNLSSIILLSSLLSDSTDHTDESTKHLNDINQAAKTSANSIRDIVWFVNPSSDNLNKLISRMHETANTMLKGIQVNFSVGKISFEDKINPEIKRNLFLIYKEILNNILKHSKATETLISIKETDGKLKVMINDNGIGFDENAYQLGNGLRNLKNRASDIDATLNINSTVNKGTYICLEIQITRLRD
jgi:two-component system, sensor histidine kinase ChiS